jgi:nuclease HARBI1
MPTQRELRVSAEVRRCHRLLLVTAAWVSIGGQHAISGSSACLALWLIRHRELRRVRRLRLMMLSRTFSLQEMSAYDVVSQMRFCKRDITYLSSHIPWMEVTTLGQVRTARRRYVSSKEEALCILLSRLAMPTRVEDLEQRFFRSKAAINEIFYEALECFLRWASPLVSEFQNNFLRSRSHLYARKIAEKSRNATQHCIGFIDGTLIEIARPPGLMQRATYSGHKRRPGLKWQAVTTPDGIVFHCFGPFEGRRHDMHLYAQSGIDDVLSQELQIDGVQHYLYGDSGYALRPYLITPFEGAVLTVDESLFNKRMSKVRVSVEWAFKDIKKYFAHVAVPRKMVLSRTPVGSWYLASCLLWNFRCCLEGSPTSTYFDCTAPTLTQYLALLE